VVILFDGDEVWSGRPGRTRRGSGQGIGGAFQVGGSVRVTIKVFRKSHGSSPVAVFAVDVAGGPGASRMAMMTGMMKLNDPADYFIAYDESGRELARGGAGGGMGGLGEVELGGGDKAVIARWVGNFHVAESDEEVAAKIRRKLAKPAKGRPDLLEAGVAYAVEVHRRNRQTYRDVMGGRFSGAGLSGGHFTLVPAYGRDYKSKAEVEADFLANKDFLNQSFDEPRPRPINREQIPPGSTVNIRYARMTKVAVLKR
jgi:hypothetical protein